MLKLLEECFAVVMLAYLSGGITGFWAGDSAFNLWRLQDNPLLLGIQMVMYGVTLSFIVLHWRKFTSGVRAGGWVLALALLALASTLWSSDPPFTLRRSLVVIATTGFGIYSVRGTSFGDSCGCWPGPSSCLPSSARVAPCCSRNMALTTNCIRATGMGFSARKTCWARPWQLR
jgi:hypothetical protein